MKNRYLLFSGDRYYPAGGANDFKGSFSTKVEAMMDFNDNHRETDRDGNQWAHIFDIETNNIVSSFRQKSWKK